jgi:hypothetical protein
MFGVGSPTADQSDEGAFCGALVECLAYGDSPSSFFEAPLVSATLPRTSSSRSSTLTFGSHNPQLHANVTIDR